MYICDCVSSVSLACDRAELVYLSIGRGDADIEYLVMSAVSRLYVSTLRRSLLVLRRFEDRFPCGLGFSLSQRELRFDVDKFGRFTIYDL